MCCLACGAAVPPWRRSPLPPQLTVFQALQGGRKHLFAAQNWVSRPQGAVAAQGISCTGSAASPGCSTVASSTLDSSQWIPLWAVWGAAKWLHNPSEKKRACQSLAWTSLTGKSVRVAERETLQHLQLLGNTPGPLKSSRLQESGGDGRSSATTFMHLKETREERGKFSTHVNWQFTAQMPVGGTQECAALLAAFVQARLLAHQRRPQPPLRSPRRTREAQRALPLGWTAVRKDRQEKR